MTIKNQLTLLVFSVILFPLIIMSGSFIIFSKFVYPSNPEVIADNFFNKIDNSQNINDIKNVINQLESPYSAFILNPSLETQRNLTNDNKALLIIESTKIEIDKGLYIEILLGVNLINEDVWIFPLLFILSIVIPLILIPILILRNIRNSINKLEHATKRIAEGDLNFELVVEDRGQIGSLTQSLDSMRQQIKDEQDRRSRFFMGVSHDLMTPLAHIGGYSEALLEGLSRDEKMTNKYLKIINGKSHQLERRITQLLDYVKSSNIEFRQDLEEHDLYLFLRDFLECHSEEQTFYNRSLKWNLCIDNSTMIAFEPELLNRALENLIQNSFKYGDNNFPVRVDVINENNSIKINVINSGEPIQEDKLNKLFEPFFRGDKSRKGDGFGLGLSTVKSIIESHGWSISVISNHVNTIFTITIPNL